ncbi:hypothetical protein NIES4073_84910 [Kalymmatonema gypsitolerans NIES-4073]|nr:hypothetical protein NIES4073_84910 [Scytonema sp. NIES-4073]
MPYQGEFANKASHFDIVKDPEVAQFLEDCGYLKPPSEEEGKVIGAFFEVPPKVDNVELPQQIIAIDGSDYPSSIYEKLPSTEIGYVKVSSVLIDMAKFGSLRVGRFVDPFRVAELQNDNNALKFLLPSSNICWKGKTSVRDSFRAVVDDHLYSAKTRFKPDEPKTSLRTTLFHLASRRPGDMGTGDTQILKLHKCPSCGSGPIEVRDIPETQNCPNCNAEVYPSDCLRLWEEVNEFQSNTPVMSRFMQVIEHLLPMHYIRYLVENSLVSLGSLAFFVDRPLAIFGTAAWLHRSIMLYLAEVNERLRKIHQPQLLIIGLQKSGQVVDHVSLIERFVQPNQIFAIDDGYRYRYIAPGRDRSQKGFGDETYYGQDFIYKTDSGRSFVFALPYTFASKDSGNFVQVKTEIHRYSNLPRVIALINHFECDLYENALIPIALAHKHTAISLVPGGRVLDILTREALQKKS